MSYTIDWSVKKVKNQIDKLKRVATDPKIDGFNTWGAKQDLYEILWQAEDRLEECSTYSDEDEFTKKRSQYKMLKTLGKK